MIKNIIAGAMVALFSLSVVAAPAIPEPPPPRPTPEWEDNRIVKFGDVWYKPAGYQVKERWKSVIVNNGNKRNSWPYTQFYNVGAHGKIIPLGHKMYRDINRVSIPPHATVELFTDVHGKNRTFVKGNGNDWPITFNLPGNTKNKAKSIRVTFLEKKLNPDSCPVPLYRSYKTNYFACDIRLGKKKSKTAIIFNNGHYDNGTVGNSYILPITNPNLIAIQGFKKYLSWTDLPHGGKYNFGRQREDLNRFYLPPRTKIQFSKNKSNDNYATDGKGITQWYVNNSYIGPAIFSLPKGERNKVYQFRIEEL